MENITSQQVLGVITALLVLLLVAPNVLRVNIARGTALRNAALWLLFFVGLVWVYQFMHPESTITPEERYVEPTPMGDSGKGSQSL